MLPTLAPETRTWLDDVHKKLCRKMPYAIEKARQVPWIPYSTRDGGWAPNAIDWWTNGFWPAAMWQMALATGDARYREEAVRTEIMLDDALAHFDILNHDAGFMWLISSGVRHALEDSAESYGRAMRAAQHLACRFNPNGFIRAWNGAHNAGWAIIDCMMNLPLLYWASRQTGDPRFRLMAERHADTAMRTFVRPDGSCHHIVAFDPVTGDVTDTPCGQGFAPGSSWSRGQAWGLYGFTLSWLQTGRREYLDTARRIAACFVSQLTEDGIPRCDLRQPAEPDLKDCAAGAIAAAGLIVLSRETEEREAAVFLEASLRMLRAMERTCVNWALDDPALLTRCTTAYHDPGGHHITMVYADYFFIEAIEALRGQEMLFWAPDLRSAGKDGERP